MKKLLIALMLIAKSVLALDIALPAKYLGYDIVNIKSITTYDGWRNDYLNCAEIVPLEAKSASLDYTVVDKKVVAVDNSALHTALALPAKYRKVVEDKTVAMTAEEKVVVDAQEMTDWNNSKTNHAEIIRFENRFMDILDIANFYLSGEGIVTNTVTPKNTTEEQMAIYLITMTNQTVSAGLSSRLEIVLKYTKTLVEEAIGNPPDGTTIRYNIIGH